MTAGPVVVAVLSHRDPRLLQRLVARILEGDRTVALVHHDPRGEPHGLVPHDRLVLVPDAGPCDWGRMNLAEAMLRCLRAGLDAVPELEWLLLVSGQDYPAQHLRRTEADLAGQDADALLRWFPVPEDPSGDVHPWQARCRRRYLHRMRIPGDRRSVPFPRRHPFRQGTGLYVGDMWANLRAPAVHHVLEQRERLGRVESYLSRCSVPDEALLPTLLLNDADHLRVLPERRRYIRWVEGRPNPELLTLDDVAAMEGSGDWFARKVDSVRTPEVLDLLDEKARDDAGRTAR
ncbi:beta-1,6-N-acetylglucosaminyltransferase [Nocardioides sp. MAHUQ-72]|uniref:beta-1,6-N-acetylglucosaminyltransferase n=1 Tax=unclassified Nocardioides TaxID=2615069 RepID=UPI00360B51B0